MNIMVYKEAEGQETRAMLNYIVKTCCGGENVYGGRGAIQINYLRSTW